jgi:pimeloyl-ACP methyl ester carboxylesterase/DNA-binding CsgD family transcriptional regulator
MKRETRYARSDGLNIAYKVVGQGDFDLVFVMGWVSNIDMFWTEPHFARFLDRLASFSRLIVFDKRGTGLSDRPVALPTLEERMDDVRAVMDAAHSEKAVLFGISEGGAMCALFAATYPERTQALIIDGGYARRRLAADYPWARSDKETRRYAAHMEAHWGDDALINVRAPSLSHDPEFREWWSTYLRMSASPGAAAMLSRMNAQIDIRQVLPAIRVPTLIMHRTGDRSITVGNGRFLAEQIPKARYVEFPGADHLPFTGEHTEAILDEIERFLTGASPSPQAKRVLATILSVEIVGAMGMAAGMGDDAWQALCHLHLAEVRETLGEHRGRQFAKATAGFTASFDGPARAIQFARAIMERASALGIILRAGLHTGECNASDTEMVGLAVQIAPRVMMRADPGQILVSGTVRDLVSGSGLEFEPLDRPLPVSDNQVISLFFVTSESARPLAIPIMLRDDIPTDARILTPREREVATLVGRGLSNRMIADELSISIATVERHVANIFTRLDVRSRAQIAAWVASQGMLASHAG